MREISMHNATGVEYRKPSAHIIAELLLNRKRQRVVVLLQFLHRAYLREFQDELRIHRITGASWSPPKTKHAHDIRMVSQRLMKQSSNLQQDIPPVTFILLLLGKHALESYIFPPPVLVLRRPARPIPPLGALDSERCSLAQLDL